MFKIQVRWPNGSVNDFVVKKDTASIGRAPESDVYLPSDMASRNHALVYLANDKVWIEDLQSSNGTYVKNEKIALPTPITSEDPVKLGDVYIRVVHEDLNKIPKFLTPSDPEYSMAQRLGNRKQTVSIPGEKGAELRRIFQQTLAQEQQGPKKR